MKRSSAAVLALAACALASAARGGEPFTFVDDFSRYPAGSDGAPAWRTDGIGWETGRGVFVCQGGGKECAEVAKAPLGREVRVEAGVTLRRAVGREWKVAGVALRRDGANFWHLALVEAPDKDGRRHFVELTEMLGGTWLANYNEATRLRETASVGKDFDWRYDRPYRMSIELGPDGITGTVTEPDGTVRARIAYAFGDAKAVTFGRPALTAGGFRAEFRDFRTRVASFVEEEERSATVRPPYESVGFDGVRGRETGFFHVEEQGERWWMIDPHGKGYYNVGTDHANWNVHWCEKLGYAPYHRNVEKIHGTEEKWADSTVARLEAWGFNSLGANSSPSVRYKGLAHTDFLSFGVAFTSVDYITERTTWTGFPNVFSPKWPRFCEKQAAARCAPQKDDPWLIGYFLDNELEWHAWTAGSPFEESFKKPRGHSAKKALVELLSSRHRTAESFNKAWGTSIRDLDELHDLTTPPKPGTDAARADDREFIRLCAEKYFSACEAAIRKHDPNHMILGCRYAGGGPDIMDIAGRHVDIFSINCYRTLDLQTGALVDGFEGQLEEWYAKVKRPFIITEWSFPALDAGLPCKHGAGQRVPTQKDKAFAFTAFQKLLFATPFMVGSNYFMWADEPELGISSTFPEDSNYGLVNVEDEPYKLLTEAATALHGHVYAIHSGRTTDFAVEAGEGRGPFIVKNSGAAAGECVAVVASNVTETRRGLMLAPGAEARVALPRQVLDTPGGHLVTCRIEPAQPLLDRTGADNAASRALYNPGAPWSGKTPSRRRVPVLVANPTDDPATPLLSLEAGDLFAREAIEGDDIAIVDISTVATGRVVPSQIDRFEEGAELAFLPGSFAPGESKTLFAYEGFGPRARGGPGRVEFERKGSGFRVSTGALVLERDDAPGGNAFDRISLIGPDGNVELGSLRPLMWQVAGQNMWIPPDRVEKVEAFEGPVRLVLDITFARGDGGDAITEVDAEGRRAPRAGRERSFRTKYRFEFPPGRRWFSSRLVWIENTDTEPMRLESYFHYTPSNIGGDASDDEAQGNRWVDRGRGVSYGVVPGSRDMHVTFWKDAGGGEHPDAYRKLGVTLAPGERYAKREPVAFVVGCRSDDWEAVSREVAALGRVVVRAFEAERR